MSKEQVHRINKPRAAKVQNRTVGSGGGQLKVFEKEMRDLQKRGYDITKNARLYAGMSGVLSTPDNALIVAKTALMKESRELLLNSAIWKKAATLMVTNLVGAAGFTMKSNIGGEKPNTKLNKRIELDFWRWVNSVECDAAGMQSFVGLLGMWVRNWFVDGDVPIRYIEVEPTLENPAGLQMHSYPAEALDAHKQKSLGMSDLGIETKIVMGVEQNKYGRPIRYHMTIDNKIEVVDASEMMLLFLREAGNASRGAPLGHAVMATVYQLEALDKSTLQAAHLNQPGGFIQRSATAKNAPSTLQSMRQDFTKGEDGDDEEESEDPLSGIVVDKAPGETTVLPEGFEFVDMPNKFPVEILGPYLLSKQREIASGLNLGHEELFNNVAEATFSSTRISTVAHRDWYKTMHGFLIDRVVFPIYRKWLMQMYLNGVYDLNAEQLHQALTDASFNGRSFGFVTPDRDMAEKEKGIALGVYSLEKVGYELGEDVRANLIANAALKKQAEELGVPITGLYDPQAQAELRAQGAALDAQASTQAKTDAKEAERHAQGFTVMQRSLDGLRFDIEAVKNLPAPVVPAAAPITVTPQVTVEAPVLNVTIGQRRRVRSTPVRDDTGRIVSIETVELEEDDTPALDAVETVEAVEAETQPVMPAEDVAALAQAEEVEPSQVDEGTQVDAPQVDEVPGAESSEDADAEPVADESPAADASEEDDKEEEGAK